MNGKMGTPTMNELRALVRDLAAHFERTPGPAKVAEYYQLRERLRAMAPRVEVQPHGR